MLVLSAPAQKSAEMPTAAKQALTKMEATVIQAKKKAIADLTLIMNAETRAGRLDSAVTINAKIKELTVDTEGERAEGKKGADFLPGVWRMQNGVRVSIEKNNTFSAAGGNFKWSGTWHVDNGQLVVDSTVFVDTYELPAKKEARNGKSAWIIRGKNNKGELVSMEKQD